MNSVIYNPLEEFENSIAQKHLDYTTQMLDELVQRSGVDPELNRETLLQHAEYQQTVAKLRKKYNWLRFLRVVMCITLVLIPLVILKTTPKIRQLRSEIESADETIADLYQQAIEQMQPLNALFTDWDSLRLVEKAVPLMSFEPEFTCEQAMNMALNYNFDDWDDSEETTLDVLAGHYNENPFLFENKLHHRLGVKTYQGSLTITWTETYYDSNGNLRSRTKTQTLHASVEKPCPYYGTQVMLNYCSQGGPDLSFSREATHLDQKSDKAIDRYVKQREKEMKRKENKAGDGEFTAMSNTTFEALFGALNRDHEVQFRTLFTPLAQTNIVSLIRSHTGYGDDFDFLKLKRTNRIVAKHSQGRQLRVYAHEYMSHSFDIIKENFLQKNVEFFKKLYFDFAPLLAIPVYQDRPVHSLMPIPDHTQMYSTKVCEGLANLASPELLVHPNTKTPAILKASYISSSAKVDEFHVEAYSYDIFQRVDYIPVYGGDGRYHDVPVYWDEYMPLQAGRNVYLSASEEIEGASAISGRNGVYAFTT